MSDSQKSREPNDSYHSEVSENPAEQSLQTIDETINSFASGGNANLHNFSAGRSRNDNSDSDPSNLMTHSNPHIEISSLSTEIRRQILEIRENERLREISGQSTGISGCENSTQSMANSYTLGAKHSDISALKFLINIIPVFTGNNISVQNFAKECRFAEERIDQALKPLFVKLIRNKIQGEADLYIRNLQFNSLEELLSILERAFGLPKTLFQLQSEVAHIKQKTGESILSYGARAMELFSKMAEIAEQQSPGTIALVKIKEYDSEIASCFRLGLQGEMEARVRQKNPITLQEAINAAIEAERDVSRRKRLYGEINVENVHENSSASHDKGSAGAGFHIRMPLRGDKQCRTVYQVKREVSQPVKTPKDTVCYTCGEEGHYSRSCPHRNFNSFSNARKRSRNDYSDKKNSPQCDYCKARGHFADRCFKRRAEEAELALEKIKKERPSTSKTTGLLNSNGSRRPGATTSKSISLVHQTDAQYSLLKGKGPSEPLQ